MRPTFLIMSVFLCFALSNMQPGLCQSKKASQDKPSVTKYAVLMITNMDKSLSFRAAPEEMQAQIKKDLDEEFRTAMKSWEEAKKEAQKLREEFNDQKPSKPLIKVLGKGMTQVEANELRTKAEEEYIDTGRDSGEAESNPKYSVLMITDIHSSVAFEIIDDAKVKERTAEIDRNYKEILKNWEAARKAAQKRKEKFLQEKPLKPKVKVLKKGLAEDHAKKVLEEARKDQEKKQGGGEGRKKKK